METIQLEHVPADYSVQAALFSDVANAEFLHQQLLSRNQDFEYAFIDATSVISRLHLFSAVFKAVTIDMAGNMKTPNIHSEIVCSLSPTNNISEAYRRYGITKASKDIIIVKILKNSDDTARSHVVQHVAEHVKGSNVPFTDESLTSLTDWPKVRKYYKLNGVNWIDKIPDEKARQTQMEMLAISSVALRGL